MCERRNAEACIVTGACSGFRLRGSGAEGAAVRSGIIFSIVFGWISAAVLGVVYNRLIWLNNRKAGGE
jgi:hypothetical protein